MGGYLRISGRTSRTTMAHLHLHDGPRRAKNGSEVLLLWRFPFPAEAATGSISTYKERPQVTNHILMVASPRAAVLGGIVPLIIILGLVIIVLAAPASKERIAETIDLIRNLLTNRNDEEQDEEQDEQTPADWSSSTADQYQEFYRLIEDEDLRTS